VRTEAQLQPAEKKKCCVVRVCDEHGCWSSGAHARTHASGCVLSPWHRVCILQRRCVLHPLHDMPLRTAGASPGARAHMRAARTVSMASCVHAPEQLRHDERAWLTLRQVRMHAGTACCLRTHRVSSTTMKPSLAHTPSAACSLPGAHAHMRAAACFPRGALCVLHKSSCVCCSSSTTRRPSTARTSSGAHARTYAAA
jgi:hypothetical protein